MKKLVIFILLLTAFVLPINYLSAGTKSLPNGLYAVMETTKGKIVLELEYKKTPMTVMNFVGLAEGTIKFANKSGKHYYDGVKFHRVIPNFMIQSGDPLGTGAGGPGYEFPNEVRPDLKFDKPGVLGMANRGPNTNGSQFFITHVATPWLNGYYTVFGHVVEGQSVVSAIAQGDTIKTVRILRIGQEAKKFKVTQAAFDRLVGTAKANVTRKAKEKRVMDLKIIKEKWPNALETKSGLRYVILKKGSGNGSPADGTTVTVNYEGKLLDGKLFDSSYKRGKPSTFKIGQVIEGWNEALKAMKTGEERLLIIPPELGYGKRGYPGVIPPNSFLVFKVELLDF